MPPQQPIHVPSDILYATVLLSGTRSGQSGGRPATYEVHGSVPYRCCRDDQKGTVLSILTRSRGRSLALVVGGVAAGVAVALGASSLTGPSADEPAAALGRPASGDITNLADPDAREDVTDPRERADSPQAAVEAFLTAEQAGDTETSFAYLSDAVRVEYGSAAAWRADHPDALPPVTGFEFDGEPTGDGDQVEVPTTTSFESSLDTVVGLVPASALTSWLTVQEEGGWAVDIFATRQQPVLPSDEAAIGAVQTWAEERQRCGEPEQYTGLRGREDLAEALCGTDGSVQAGAVAALQEFDAGPLTGSFGAEVRSWARTVELDGPVPLRAAVAPVDDRWLVIGVLAPAGQG